MAIQIQQDGTPYIPEPDDRKYPDIGKDVEELRRYLRALTAALREYFLTQKVDVDVVTTRLNTGLAGTKVYYVADSSGGAVTRKLTFVDGILTSET